MNPALNAAPLLAPVTTPSLSTLSTRTARRGALGIAAWAVLMGGWAAWAPIAGGVVVQGIVKVDANRRTVTHRDGGTVAAVRVHEGQTVARGDVLVELEDVRVNASVDMLRAQLAGDLLRQSRLEAEAAGQAQWRPPADLLAEFGALPGAAEQAQKEQRLFTARQANLAAQVAGEQEQARSARAEIAARTLERSNAGKAVALMKDELQINEKLEREQFVHKARVLGLQRTLSEYESRQLGNEADLAQAQQRLGAAELRVRSLRDSFVQTASDELREVGVRISDTRQRLRASSDDQARQKVLAPEAGVLMNLRVNTVGSALGPREPIVDIVPSGTPLLIEARLPVDVGADVRPGLPAEVRMSTAHSRYQPLLPATLVQVSADALADERSGQPYLRAQVQVAPTALAQHATAFQPGMAAEVYIQVSERSPLGYLGEPVTGYFHRAFRER